MRSARLAVLAAAVFALVGAAPASASWNLLGGAVNNGEDNAFDSTIASIEGTPYIVWEEGRRSYAKAFTEGTWTGLGEFMTAGTISRGAPDIVQYAGSPVVAWDEGDFEGTSEIRVSRYDGGGEWTPLGTPGSISKNDARDPSLGLCGFRLCVAWTERDDADERDVLRVKILMGGTWLDYGANQPLNAAPDGSAGQPELVQASGRTAVLWTEGDEGRANDERLQGKIENPDRGTWDPMGAGPIMRSANGFAESFAVTDFEGFVHVAWAEDTPSPDPEAPEGERESSIWVSRYDPQASTWSAVAPATRVSDAAQLASSVSLASIGGALHVGYSETDGGSLDGDLRVKRLSPGRRSWAAVRGTGDIEQGTNQPSDTSLADIDGRPHLSWTELIDSNFQVFAADFRSDLETVGAPVTVAGSPAPGQTLTCSPGEWSRQPTFEYLWERAARGAPEDDPAWGAIDGAAGPEYVVQDADAGSDLRCRVIATDPPQRAEEVSAVLRADAGPPRNLRAPRVTGTPVVGDVLTCEAGEWTPSGDFAYRWYRGEHRLVGQTASTYRLNTTIAFGDTFRGDPGFLIRCEVTVTNDLGSTTAGSENALLAVAGPPRNLDAPRILERRTRPNLPDLICEPGRWLDDYAVDGREGFAYQYQWLRGTDPIAGAVDKLYRTTIDDLGKQVRCRVTSGNPAGRGQPADSAPVLVALPAVASRGRLLSAQGTNQFVPTNLMALGQEYDAAVQSHAREQLLRAKAADEGRCRAAGQFNAGLTRPSDAELVVPFGPQLRCRILWHFQPQNNVRSDGAFLAKGVNGRYQELDMGFGIAPVDPSRPLPIDPLLRSRLAAVTPTQVIWDVDDDGRTDATCPGAAPVLRSLLGRGDWNPRAIVVYPDSAQTGVFSEARFQNGAVLENPPRISNLPQGRLRNGQPFACRTSLEQPAEPATGPCITEGTVGRVRVTGNLCPISVRAMKQSEIDHLKTNDGPLYDLLVEMAEQLNRDDPRARAARRSVVGPETHAELLPRQFLDIPSVPQLPGAPPLPDVGAALTNTASSYAGFKVDGRLPAHLQPPPVPRQVAAKVPNLKVQNGQFALDQMYVARGPLKVNGITFTPQTPDPALLVPSDVREAMSTVTSMKLAIPDARKQLDTLVLETKGRLRAEVDDRVNQARTELMRASLDKIRDAAKNLKFGPFKWSGDMDVKLENDGTATMNATASIPFLAATPGGGGLTSKARLRGDREGRISLQGFTLKAPRAYLGVMTIKDLFFQYDNGIKVQGKIVFPFPPANPAINIYTFELGPTGAFRALDIEFEAGAGGGIAVGPGVFLTSLRAGFNEPLKKFNGGAGLSVGPSAGGGCPTLGIRATFDITFREIVSFDAKGNVILACIPLFEIDVHADTTGYVTLAGGFKFSAGPVFLESRLAGSMRLPDWQIEYSGKGGIRKIPIVGSIDATLQGVLGNRGLAACASIRVVLLGRVAAGAGVRFPGGRPPLALPELLSNLRLFTGCDLSSWKSLPARVRAAQDGGAASFVVPEGKRGMGWAFEGAGDAPRVRLRSPSGKVYDFGDAVDGKEVQGVYGVVVEDEDRSIVLIGKPEAGRWTAEALPGSPAIARIEQSDILPPVRVKGQVGGLGSSRVLRYDVPRIAGQVVRFVEEAGGAQKRLRTVRGGGAGTVRFQTSEATGTRRRIVAQVLQDGLPRDNVTVARFRAPSPRVARPGRLRVTRRGTRVLVSWRRAALARSYDVRVDVTDGQRLLLSPSGRRLRITVPNVGRRERVRVRVIGISRAGRRGPAATRTLKVARRRAAGRRRG